MADTPTSSSFEQRRVVLAVAAFGADVRRKQIASQCAASPLEPERQVSRQDNETHPWL
jgi:hypothetical protein